MNKHLSVFVLSVIFHCTLSAYIEQVKDYKGFQIYEIFGPKKELNEYHKYLLEAKEFADAQSDGSLFVEKTEKSTSVMMSPALKTKFLQSVIKKNLRYRLVNTDFAELLRIEKGPRTKSREFSWTSYYDVDDIYKYLQNVSKTYPESAEVVVGGKSYQGRKILGLKINTPLNKKNQKPAIFIESGIHAREWITPATTTYFIDQLMNNPDPNITMLRDSFEWHIFPTVNPDGYHYSFTMDRMWRKTRSKSPNGCYGADPNRNWDHNWNTASSSSNPCDYQLYAGSEPFSEIETRTLSEYVSEIENLMGYLAFHSYAQTLLLPYSDSKEHLDNYDDLVQIGKTSLEYGRKVNGEKYDGPGTAAEILYAASGGSMDWVREALGTQLVMTYELRGYYFHWPAAKIYEQGDEVTQMILGFAVEAGQPTKSYLFSVQQIQVIELANKIHKYTHNCKSLKGIPRTSE